MFAAGCLLLAFSCSVDIAPRAQPPAKLRVPDPIDLRWRGFDVHLEPTVVLWARDARLDVRDLIRGSLTRVDRALDTAPTRITIQAGSVRVIPDVGIGGHTDRVTAEIKITMDHRSPVVIDQLLRTWVPIALAHEIHHAKRILEGPGYGATLLEAMVTEGAAEAFVRSTYPDAPPIPWVAALEGAEATEAWRRALAELDEPYDPVRHDTWFFGREGLPRWAGYRIGYAIARSFLERHPERTAADLATMPADEIFSGSAYEPTG